MQAAAYEANALPLDGINLDTEWHRNQKGYLDGNRENWYSGVFDWDRTLYNSPMEMMDWLETRCGGRKTPFVAPFHAEIDHFTKTTGSGQHTNCS